MFRIVIAVCCLALLGAGAAVHAQERLSSLTLEQALRLASETNPNVRAKEFELKAVGAGEITAGLRPNPTANFLAEQFGGASSASQTQYTINIGQPIELGGKRQRRIDSATAQTNVTTHELADLRRQIDFQVKKTFTDILAAEAAGHKAPADIDLRKANAGWDVTPQVECQRIGPDNTIGVGFGLPLRIFGRNQGEIARTRADALRVDAVRDAVVIRALSEVDTALAAVDTERGKVEVLRDTYLPKAKQARETVEFAYRRGGVSLLDYLDA